MFREVEQGLWLHQESGWMARATSLEDAERQYAERQVIIERDRLRREDGRRAQVEKIPEFKPTLAGAKRKLSSTPFKLPIDNERDLDMRLRGSVIYVGPDPVYVDGVFTFDGQLWLMVGTADGQTYRIPYSHPKIDCRTSDPKYIVYDHQPFFMVRYPSRHQKQGMDGTNISLRYVGIEDHRRIDSLRRLCEALQELPPLDWSPQYSDLMVRAKAFKSLRLSNDISFFVDDGLKAEYKGRELGAVHDNEILVDEMDFAQPWIKEEIRNIGCEAKLKRV